MKFTCSSCSKSFSSKGSLDQHTASKHSVDSGGSGNNSKKYIIGALIVAIVVFASMSVYSHSQKPGAFDDFASCLSDRGAVMYGNDFCSYSNQQLNSFGKSQDKIEYVKCADNEALCNEKGVTLTPTWEFNGKTYSGVQSFDTLAALTGCKYK